MDEKYSSELHLFQKAVFESRKNQEGRLSNRSNQLNLHRVFAFIKENFNEIKAGDNVKDVLPLLHHALHMDASGDIDAFIHELLKMHGTNEADLLIVLQITYQLLQDMKSIDILGIKDRSDVQNQSIPNLLVEYLQGNHSRCANSKILSCIQLYVRAFNDSAVIEKLWTIFINGNYEQGISPSLLQISVHLFDEFILYIEELPACTQLVSFVQQLLLSSEREERRSGYFLIRKMQEHMNDRKGSSPHWEIGATLELSRCWNEYVTIMENLDENKSNLILPSLNMIGTIDDNRRPASTFWKKVIDLLYRKILSSNNILVIRWALEYILTEFNCGDLSAEVLLQFLEALNNTSLYNKEGYFLAQHNINRFLNTDQSLFLELFAKVNWKSVPLHFWLTQLALYGKSLESVTKELLLKIAARVRVLQNPALRQITIELFENMFSAAIDRMHLDDYITFIEALYNVIDPYRNLKVFTQKLELCTSAPNVSKRFYDILTYNLDVPEVGAKPEVAEMVATILKLLAKTPPKTHSWLRFLTTFDAQDSEEIRTFCKENYDINLEALHNSTLEEVTKTFHNKLVWHNGDEAFVRQKSVDFFVCRLLTQFSDLSKHNIQIADLVDMGTQKTLAQLSTLIRGQKDCCPSDVGSLIQRLKIYAKRRHIFTIVAENIIQHCRHTQCKDYTATNVEAVLDIDLANLAFLAPAVLSDAYALVSKDCIMGRILYGDAKTGDARIEESYEYHLLDSNVKIARIRLWCEIPSNLRAVILTDLLKLNDDLNRQRPKYFKNCKEHRLKMRIARAISKMVSAGNVPNFLNRYWNILMEQVNQINVTCLYEAIASQSITSIDFIFDKLQQACTYTARQQLSLISIGHFYCIWNAEAIKEDQLNRIISLLLPLTMVADFKTRLLAQLAVYNILVEFSKNTNINIRNADDLQTAFAVSLGAYINEISVNIRLQMCHIIKNNLFWDDVVMLATNSPFDEYSSSKVGHNFETGRDVSNRKQTIEGLQEHSIAATHSDTKSPKNDTQYIQRKSNPTDNILVKPDFITYPKHNGAEIYVVASLIDKLANLGGIARTCEVLGLQNLVVDSKSHLEAPEFNNLSMTAENGLNIIEVKSTALTDFLFQKQCEGFEIVGPENASHGISLVGFEFPKKCILLLGHEIDGIPPDLIAFLDHPVVVPQCGSIPSLNVHVTGALFMWEYCKQHVSSTHLTEMDKSAFT